MLHKKLTALIFTFMLIPYAYAQTVYTGDKLHGFDVISKLDIGDLAAGKTHRLMFQGVEMGSGQRWHVPLMVAKGKNEGKRLLITAGIHGDETSPVAVVQKTFAEIDPEKISGTVIGILDISRASVEQIQRKWPISESGGHLADMNRVWPGQEFGNAAQRQAWLVWNNVFKNNVDIVLDFHTASTGQDFALFIFADYSNKEAKRLAELFPVDQIKDDPGLSGTMETSFMNEGIPAITVEVGGPRHFDARMIQAGVEGVKNVMSAYKISTAPRGRTAKETNAFFGNKMEAIRAKTGGYVEMLVDLNTKVSAGQKVAIQRNFFGDVVHEYVTGVEGEVSIIARDALREPGTHLISILTTDSNCKKDCVYDASEIGQ